MSSFFAYRERYTGGYSCAAISLLPIWQQTGEEGRRRFHPPYVRNGDCYEITLMYLALAGTSLFAQQGKPQGLTSQPNQTDSAMTAETRRVFQTISDNLSKAAHEMPENLYAFRPDKGVRSFGELIAHIAEVQSTLCSNMNGHAVREATTPASKDNLIQDPGYSSQECNAAFDELSAQNTSVKVQTPVGQLTRMRAMSMGRSKSIFA